jgi:hypothetical protein
MALECLWTQTGKLQITGASIFYRSLWLLQCVQELANPCALPVRCNQCDTVNLSRCGSSSCAGFNMKSTLQVTYMSCLKPTFFGDLVCWCDTLDVLSESGQKARRTWSEKPLLNVSYQVLQTQMPFHASTSLSKGECATAGSAAVRLLEMTREVKSISRRKAWQLCRTWLDVNGLAIKSLLWNHGHYQLWGYLAFDLRSKRSNWCWSCQLPQR